VIALPAAVAFLPFVENLVSSQKGTLWLLLFTATFVALARDRPLSAGLLFGLQALKPQLALVVPVVLLAKRAWRFVAGVAVTVAALVLVSIATGPDLAREYVRFAGGAADYARFGGGYLNRLHGLYGFFTLLAGGPTPAARVATAAATGVVVLLLGRLFRGPLDVRGPRFPLQFAGLVVATLLVSPHVVTYDLTLLLLPMFLVGAVLVRGAVPTGRRRAVLWLLVATYLACGVSQSIASRTGFQLAVPTLLALLAVVALTDLAPIACAAGDPPLKDVQGSGTKASSDRGTGS
jgi:hypothetical protein